MINTDDHEPTQSLRSILQQAVDEITNPNSGHSLCRYGIDFSIFPYGPSHREGIYDRGWVVIAALACDWLKGIVSM